ncbi:MAG: hypothetical protein K2P57_02610 [Burkholderiales bacterium]|nr:hypothetical protein [Burkholderiales bacterium]
MMKCNNPSERNARPYQIVTIVEVRTIRIKAANDRCVIAGMDTQKDIRRTERIVGKGQYLGFGNTITAFIWLDQPQVMEAA